ncbi:hypothetical protein [Mesorhizobium sp. WSM2239]|uniref:Uncharacterized protein n=2 Tax=unclassified Mesorhizobium TaxID=325217 RepID=A0AAU8DF57_9HYPH
MAVSRKQEARALSEDEWQLVQMSHHPAVQDLPDAELIGLIKSVRERRDRAQTEAYRKRREMRGKASPKGAQPATKDRGTQAKLEVLAMSMRRLNGEHERRRRLAAKLDLAEKARNALTLKQRASESGAEFNTRHAHQGMRAVESRKRKNLIRPMELGRQRQAAKVAQARRDAR